MSTWRISDFPDSWSYWNSGEFYHATRDTNSESSYETRSVTWGQAPEATLPELSLPQISYNVVEPSEEEEYLRYVDCTCGACSEIRSNDEAPRSNTFSIGMYLQGDEHYVHLLPGEDPLWL